MSETLDMKQPVLDRALAEMEKPDVCLLRRSGDLLLVHDWLDYAGQYLRYSLWKRKPHLWQEAYRIHGLDPSPDRPPTVRGQSAQQDHTRPNPTTPDLTTAHDPGGGGGGDAAAGKGGAGIDPAILRELELCQVGEPNRSRLARLLSSRNVIPLQVRALWVGCQDARRNPVGLLCSKLEGDLGPVSLTPRQVVALVDGGHVVAIDGHPVSPRSVGPLRDAVVIFPRPCMNLDHDRRPPPVATVPVEGIEDELTLSGHEGELAKAGG
jgi:hypothetical protein